MKRLIDGATLWDGENRLVEGAALLVEGERIEAIWTKDDPARRHASTSAERIDASGCLAIPGLICAHTHLYSALARGLALPGFAPTSFRGILEGLWWRLDKALDPEAVRTSALIGAMEAARSGVATLIDHHASPRAITGSLEAVREAASAEVGLRVALAYEVSDRDGPRARDLGIRENATLLAKPISSRGLSAPLFGLHASFTLSDETLEAVAAALPDGAGVHVHVAEGPEDEGDCVAQHGLRVVERLDRYGLLRPRSVLAHCLHLDEAEKDLVAERGSIVVHNPRSNMNNAVGLFDLSGFLRRRVLTGLGTDGLGANLLSELLTAGILQKHSLGDPRSGGFDALHALLFDNNPEIAERVFGVRLGRFAPGAPADIALLRYTPPTPLRAENVLGHLLFGIAVHDLRVDGLFVAGREVLRQGRFVSLDEERIYAEARGVADRLWRRAADVR